MAIRPVEVQGMVQRSQDVTSIKANQDNKSNVDQTNIFVNHQKQLQQKQENVIKKENVDYNDEKYDAKEKGKNEYENNQRNQRKKKEEEDGKVVLKNNTAFDVRI